MGKVPFFFVSIQNRNRGGGACRGDLPAVDGGRPGHNDGREWGRREEVEGDSFLSSPRAGAACGGRSSAVGGL
jgi:hypothetical protein